MARQGARQIQCARFAQERGNQWSVWKIFLKAARGGIPVARRMDTMGTVDTMDGHGDEFDTRDGVRALGGLGASGSAYLRMLHERGRLVPLVRSVALLGALFGLLLLAGCTLFNGGSGSSSTKSLSDLGWCDSSQSPRFQDDSTASQPVITSWSSVKDQLGFTYLPSSLPSGSCLALAGGSIHDPVYGGHLDVTYLLPGSPDQVPLAFSEDPSAAACQIPCNASRARRTTAPTSA